MCRPSALIFVLVAFVITAGSISWFNLLGEAPDEAAHMHLIRFISEHSHPPRSYAERESAGYKSDSPMLYHLLIGMALSWVDYATLPRLKEYSTDPRRLLIADGLPPFAVVHTEDELFPFRGIVLAWHLARLISLLFSAATIVTVYLAARAARPKNEALAVGAAALIATCAQFTFIAAAVNDDSLLGLLSTLFTWCLVQAWRQPTCVKPYAMAGLCLGLAITTKYSVALFPLLVAGLLALAVRRNRLSKRAALGRLVVFAATCGGAAAWWFIFVLWHFNEVRQLGWLVGLVKPFMGGARADASLRQVASFLTGGALPGSTEIIRPSTDWFRWLGQMFVSFWLPGSPLGHPFGIVLCASVALLTALALAGLLRGTALHDRSRVARPDCAPGEAMYPHALLVFQVLLLMPFPILRYILTGNVIETAQGRHVLFPAAMPIGLLLAAGLASWFKLPNRQPALLGVSGILLGIGLFNFYGVMAPAFPEPLPVRTTADAAEQVTNPVHLPFGNAVELLGYEVRQPNVFGALPVTLTWRSTGDSSEDLLTDLFLVGEDGVIYARWLGHPAGGRYPTRAWQSGDVVRDATWLVVVGLRAGAYRLCLRLVPVTATNHPERAPDGGHCLTTLALSNVSTVTGRHVWQLPDGRSGTLDVWQSARTDDPLPIFRYRATIQISLNAQPSERQPYIVTLLGPEEVEQAALYQTGNVYTFLVDARWSPGRYRVRLRSGDQSFISEPVLEVRLRRRDFAVPPMQHVVNAHFGGEITLLGYDLPQCRVQPGSALPVTLYWRAERDVQRHYIVFNHLLGADRRQWGGRDRIPRDYYSTALWAAGEVVRDEYALPVDAAAPPGVYHLDVGLYQMLKGQIHPLWLVDAEGNVLNANSVTLTTIKVGGAPPDVIVSGTLAPEHPRADSLGELVTLIGYDLSVQPTEIEIVLYWRCDASLPADYTTFVHLTKAGTAEIVAQMDRPPANGAYPTSLWDVGEVIRDVVTMPLPVDLPPGEYDILAGLYDITTGQRLAAVGAAT
ncbi:MAG: ArnT family glycosyltransferase, partial [Anaerolineae bacterium]